MSSQAAAAPPRQRAYRSPRREQQAVSTRLAILDAAEHLFERHGYTATTIEAIADRAGVSSKTVYLAFASKSALLRAVWDRAVKGDTDDAPLGEREWYREILVEPDPRRQVQLIAMRSSALKERIGRLQRAIRSAAAVDPDCAELLRAMHDESYASHRRIIDALARHGGLRPGIDTKTAADIMWSLNQPEVWLLLTGDRGWTRDQFAAWFARTLAQQLLDDSA